MEKQFVTLISLAASPFTITAPAWAESNQVSIDQLDITKATITVPVSVGYGMVLDFSAVGQIVKAASLVDPSRIVISGIDGNLCYLQEKCLGNGASVIRLTQVSGIKFPGLTSAADGGTTLTLITEGKSGRKTLQMRVIPVKETKYTALVVAPRAVGESKQPSDTQRFSSITNFNSRVSPSSFLVEPRNSSLSKIAQAKSTVEGFTLNNTNRYKPTEFYQNEPVIQNDSLVQQLSCKLPNIKVPQSVQVATTAQEDKQFLKLNSEQKQKSIEVKPDDSANNHSKPYPSNDVGVQAATASTMDVTSAFNRQPKPLTTSRRDAATSYNLIKQQWQGINDAKALNRGLWMIILGRGDDVKINHNLEVYQQIRTAIAALINANSRAEAAAIAHLDLDLIEQLIHIGQNGV